MTRGDRFFMAAIVLAALASLGSLGYCAVWGARDLRCVGALR